MTGGVTLEGPSAAPRADGAARQLVVLLHGWGADGDDLIGLAPYWGELLPEAAFVSPHAPFPCDMGFGRQWFSLADRSPETILAEVRLVAPMIDAFIDAQLAAFQLPPSCLAIVGFSQGTMMALHIAPRRDIEIAALVGYSGRLIGADLLEAETKSRPPIVLIHGERDEIVPAGSMESAGAALAGAGFAVATHLRPGLGHGIDPEGIAVAGRFIAERFA
ncbi:MAG TPA: dienelactone hydrolase family protein [Alphaproteobacteria bacterium]|nr:dienelactone hydrolase family protein [Alphaproteobacteria bacterium]